MTMTSVGTAAATDKDAVCLLLHTVDGSIPFLTPQLLKTYFPSPQPHLILGVAVRDTCIVPVYENRHTAAAAAAAASTAASTTAATSTTNTNSTTGKKSNPKKKKKRAPQDKNKPCGYEFSSSKRVLSFLQPYNVVAVPTFDVVQDAIEAKQVKKQMVSTDNCILLWTPHGRHALTNVDYQKISHEGLAPNTVVSLYDVAQDDETQKRRHVASRRTSMWLQRTLKDYPENSDISLWAPLALTGRPDDTNESARAFKEEARSHRVSGFVVVGYSHLQNREVRRQRLRARLQDFADCKKSFAVLSTTSLEQVMECICEGVDSIGSGLPADWAKRHKALCIELSGWGKAKRARIEEESPIAELDADGCIDIGNECWASDTRPILQGCCCLACRRYSRAYIHHLVKAKELLAQIALMAHNLHRMLDLCKEATVTRQKGKVEDFTDYILSQLGR
mmetsp:Transcript_13404/g.22823  ORF Transcript_13404/g.22823 Transcript_13404/m.22823 type:complete len:449 (-) Transcript_13404:82-1428(-)